MENRENFDAGHLLRRREELENMITDTLTELHRLEEAGNPEEVVPTTRTLEALEEEKMEISKQLKEQGIE